MRKYTRMLTERNQIIENSNLRFFKKDRYFVEWKLKENKFSCAKLSRRLCKKRWHNKSEGFKKISEMSNEEKQERLRYLWYRVRVISSANLFI